MSTLADQSSSSKLAQTTKEVECEASRQAIQQNAEIAGVVKEHERKSIWYCHVCIFHLVPVHRKEYYCLPLNAVLYYQRSFKMLNNAVKQFVHIGKDKAAETEKCFLCKENSNSCLP